MKEIKAKKGFTIIEVVLVLAIAGLIFLMVFIALPALQRGQRDTQRRNDMSRFMSQVNSFQTNNRGRAPGVNDVISTGTTPGRFLTEYMMMVGQMGEVPQSGEIADAGRYSEFMDPQSGRNYRVIAAEGDPNGTSLLHTNGDFLTIVFAVGHGCSGEMFDGGGHGDRVVAIRINLEGAGTYCQTNL